jgi:hypothetical protein
MQANTIFLTTLIAVCAVSSSSSSQEQGLVVLRDRALTLPQMSSEACSPTNGRADLVPAQRHIFGARGVWFGSGPVYFALSWKDSADTAAEFSLAPVPFEGGSYRIKTPWVADTSYEGPVLIRGQQLDETRRPVHFNIAGAGPRQALALDVPNFQTPLWSFWPSEMWVPGAGCYGIQIDTQSGTDIVVFRAD